MKHFKRLFSYLVALTMVLSLATFAGVNVHAEGKYTLTIKNSDGSTFADDYSFDLYQILTGDVTPNEATTTIDGKTVKTEKTLSNIEWGSSVTDKAKADTTIGSDAKAFAAKLQKDTDKENTKVTAEAMAKILANTSGYLTKYDKTGSLSSDKKSYTFTGLPGGYYLVKDTTNNVDKNDATSRYIVEIVGNTETETKKSVPTTIKKVKENTKTVTDEEDAKIPGLKVGDKYNDVADYDIGDKVPFELIGTLPNDYDKYDSYYYQFTDDMDQSFTFDKSSVKVYYSNDKGSNWTEITSGFTTSDADENNEFKVTFENLKNVTGVTSSSKIKVEFKATLNANAKIGIPGNVNESYLTFSNDVNSTSHGQTAKDKVIVFTYEIDTTKIDGATKNNANPTTLKDAHFKIKNSDGKWLKQTPDGLNSWDDSEDNAKEFISNDQGKFVIKGLDSGTYTFHETQAPSGYNLGNDVTATLTATTINNQSWDGTSTTALTKLQLNPTEEKENEQDSTNHGVANLSITNDKGSNLPSTGGMGTTLLYVAGGILVACAAAYVIINRKKSAKK